jgi:hypothetical protein
MAGSGLGRGGTSGDTERLRANDPSSNSATAQLTGFNTPSNSDRIYTGLIAPQETLVGIQDNSGDATSRDLLRNVQSVDMPGFIHREGNTSLLSNSANPTYQQPFVYDSTSLLAYKQHSIVTRCTEKALNGMWDHIKEHERKYPLIPLRWQGFFSEAVEETIDEKLKSYVLLKHQPYTKMEWKTRHDVWTPDKFFKTLIPLVRNVEENKTPVYLFLQMAEDVVYDCREDSTGDYQFRIDIKKQLALAQVVSELEDETRTTFSAHQRRTLYKTLLDNIASEDKGKENLCVRKKVVKNLRNILQAQNDSE